MTALVHAASSGVLLPLPHLQGGKSGPGASFWPSPLQHTSCLKQAQVPADGCEAADEQQIQLDDAAALRRGSNDSSGEQVAGIPQLAALSDFAQRRSAAQRSMQSLDDLSWARRSGQDGCSFLEASSVGTFTRGLERIANQMPTPARGAAHEKDEYLMRLLGGPRGSGPLPGSVPTAASALQLPPPLPLTRTTPPLGAKGPATSSLAPSSLPPASSMTQLPATTASTCGGASRNSQAARLAAHLAGATAAEATTPGAASQQPAGSLPATIQAQAPTARTRQRLGLAGYGRAREALLTQQGEFNSQIFALHAAARRQRQLVAACEEPELYSMALARVQAAAPFVAAKASFPAEAVAVAAADKPAAAAGASPSTHNAEQAQEPALAAPTPQQQLQQAVLQQQGNAAPQLPAQQAQPHVAHSMQQQQQPPVMVMMQQQQQAVAQGMYGHAAAFDPMSAWYAMQYGGPQQQQFFGSAGPQLAMQQAALAQQQALMQQQLTACQMQQQMLCSGMQAQPGMQMPAGHHPSQQQHMSVLYGQGPLPGAGALSSADLPGAGAAAGQPPAAGNGLGPEPAKWWQSSQAAFGAAALPAGISSANAFYSSQDALAAERPAQPPLPPQPKPVSTRPVRAAAVGGKRSPPTPIAVPPKKRSRSTSTPSSREEHFGQSGDPDRNGGNSVSPRGVSAGVPRASASNAKNRNKTQHGAKRGAAMGRKRAAESISSGCSKAGIDGIADDPESAAPPAALESAAGILLSFSGCG
jgi:chemotaxis protein histidine kinase CheA